MLAEILVAMALAGASDKSDQAPPAQPAAAAPSQTLNWARRPTAAQMTAVFPIKALQTGAGGEATIGCQVNFDGGLDDCQLIEESPTGFGFGDSALRLAPMFQMTKGVGSPDGPRPTVAIPIRWKAGHAMPALRDHYIAHITGPRWLTAPTVVQVAAAYPAGAGGAAGYVYMSCHVIRDGSIGRCETLDEEPAGKGFAKAAQSLTPKFHARVDEHARKEALDIWTELRVRFRAPSDSAPSDRMIDDTGWLDGPDPVAVAKAFPPEAAAKGVKTGRGLAECRAAAQGAMEDCAPLAANPPGMGFSEAAVRIASGLRASAWTDAGGPVEGARVRVPIEFGADNPNDADSLHERGLAERSAGSLDAAIADFTKSIALAPKNAKVFFDRGVVYDWQGHLDLAIADYTQSIALDPNDSKPYGKRSVAYEQKGLHDLAIADFSRDMELRPADAVIVYDRGVAFENKGLHDLAIGDFDNAIAMKPDFADAYSARGDAYHLKGLNPQAAADFDRAIALDPKLSFAYRGRGAMRMMQGDFKLANADLDQALALDPRHAAALQLRGWTRFFLGRYAGAADDFSARMRLAGSDSYNPLWLYLSRAKSGKLDTGELSTGSAKIDLSAWPGPVISLFLGRSSPADVRAVAARGDAEATRTQACEATFYLAEYDLIRSDSAATAKPLFAEAARTCPKSEVESVAADVEFNRIP